MIRLVGLMMAVIPATVLAVTPANGPAPTLTPVTINNGPGDQYDPHVSGDFAAYTSDLSIRYYRFSTATDDGIPLGPAARDLLSDISGSKIVFSRVITGVKTAVMVFDSSTAAAPIEVDPASGVTRIGSAIGGNTVAYVDFTLESRGELVIHDLTTSTSTRITNDAAYDANPSVSPDGTVVTWEHCATSSSNCDVWQAVKSGAVWTVAAASDSTNPEANPDTNGSLVVYDSNRAGNADLYWRPVAGGAEVQLQLSGFEANPSIAGNFIAFESRPSLFDTTDIFVYDIGANRLYQITNTPLVTEQLNDITLLGNGYVRVVWASDEDGFDQRNVKGATFYLGAPNACLARTVVLDASQTWGNNCNTYDATATMNPAMTFKIPASVTVTAGNAGNGYVKFTYKNGNGAPVTCKYKSGSNQSHPTSATELAKASKYNFHSCDAQGSCNDPEAGDEVTATWVKLHVDSGDTHKPSTAVRMTLNEVCPAAPAPPPPPKPKHGHHGSNKGKVTICHTPGNDQTLKVSSSAVAAHLAHGDTLGACGGGSGHPDDDDDDDCEDHDHHGGHHHHGNGWGSHHDDLTQAPDAKQGPMGCASTGGAPAVLMILAVGAWLTLGRRRTAQRAVVLVRTTRR